MATKQIQPNPHHISFENPICKKLLHRQRVHWRSNQWRSVVVAFYFEKKDVFVQTFSRSPCGCQRWPLSSHSLFRLCSPLIKYTYASVNTICSRQQRSLIIYESLITRFISFTSGIGLNRFHTCNSCGGGGVDYLLCGVDLFSTSLLKLNVSLFICTNTNGSWVLLWCLQPLAFRNLSLGEQAELLSINECATRTKRRNIPTVLEITFPPWFREVIWIHHSVERPWRYTAALPDGMWLELGERLKAERKWKRFVILARLNTDTDTLTPVHCFTAVSY